MTVLAPRPQPDASREAALPRLDPVTRLPILILYPHSRCNCRCLMCDIWRDRNRQEISAEDVAGWLGEWRSLGVRRVVLSGGEALLHSHLWDLCGLLKDEGIGITILTTGLLLARDADPLAFYCDDVVVSLDGPREVHDRIRNVPGAFDRLAEGIAALRAAGPHPADIAISGRCTVQRANFRELRATVAAARELGLDRLSFLAVDVTSEAFNRPGGWDSDRVSEVALRREDLPALAAELDSLDYTDGFLAESPEKLRRRLLQHFAALLGEDDFAPVDCNAPWVSAVVEADGTVRPCFFQPPLGNLRRAGSLNALLNSPQAIAWRQGLDTRRDEVCRRCVCSLSLREGA